MRSFTLTILTFFTCLGMICLPLSSHSPAALSQISSSQKSSEQILLSVDEITNYFLYGKNFTPDLVDENLIRDPLAEGAFAVSVPALNMHTFMTTGPGRFIRGQHFELIDDFFTVELIRFTDDPNFEFGKSYSIREFADFIDIDTSCEDDPNDDNKCVYKNASIQQYDYADSINDYGKRAYIFNSSGFTIASNAQFIVLQDGQRFIDNFTIRPFDDNFDFISNSLIAFLGNLDLENAIDPSMIGRTIDIPIRDGVTSLDESFYDYNGNGYYDGEDYAQDNALINDWLNQGSSKPLLTEMENVVTNLWDEGIIKFLDKQKRPIIYGTNNGETLDNTSFNEPNLVPGFNIPEDKQLRGYVDNGVVLIGGAGDDKLDGNSKTDKLIGGKGNDTLDGNDSEDIAKFSSSCSEYDFDASAFTSGTWTIIHARGSQEDGTDTLHNIEHLQFSDMIVTLPDSGDGANLCTGQDIAFVIDITSSMHDDIAAVKNEANNIINAIFSKENSMVNSRIAIVGYRDPGEVYTILPFTEQVEPEERKTAAINSINSILVSGGGDDPEGVYSGLLHTLNGSSGTWRKTAVVRRIILFGDAPPKDYELADTVNALARDVNADIGPIPTARGANTATVPVEIFTVAVGSNAEMQTAFEKIAKENSGRFFTAGTAGDVVNAILDAVSAPPVTVPNVIDGTEGDDVLYGTENADEIRGLNGNDQIQGEGGSDILWGDGGNDTMWGWTGDDQLNGGTGDDLLGGDEGNDRIAGDEGDDTLWGWAGDDRLDGGTGNDLLGGDEGNDTYIYHPHDGHDTVADLLGNNRLRLEGNINNGQVRISLSPKSDSDYVLFFDGFEGSITFLGQVVAAETGLAEIIFSDGTVWNRNAITERVDGTGPDVPNPPFVRNMLYLPLIQQN